MSTTYKFKAGLGDSKFEILTQNGRKEDIEVGILPAIGRRKKVDVLDKSDYRLTMKGKNCIVVLKKALKGDSFVIIRG